MNAWEPVANGANDDETLAPLTVRLPPPGAPTAPLVFASPHSGRIYPRRMVEAARISPQTLRRSEDAFVDALIEGAPGAGIVVIVARLARAFVDVNRGPWELDPHMFEDELPPFARVHTARVAAGLGVIARTVGEGGDIYARKLTFAEARTRVEGVHHPYHETLAGLIADVRERRSLAILIDWHSMPAAAAGYAFSGAGCDIVLGDRFGAACSPTVSRLVERELRDVGYTVARNAPYAGGYTTEHYGRPAKKVHALQIEVNRALYLNEATLTLTDGFAGLKSRLEQVFERLAAIDWASA